MIGCDYCEEWYHISCLNLKREEVRELTKCKWMCPKCELKDKKMTKGEFFIEFRINLNINFLCNV